MDLLLLQSLGKHYFNNSVVKLYKSNMICVSETKDLANRWTDMVLHKVSFNRFSGRFKTIK